MPKIPPQVAVLVETDDSWGRSVVEAIASRAREFGWSLLIGPRDGERRLRIPPRWSGDGVIVSLRDAKMARHVRNIGVPAVDVSITMPQERWLSRVATDDTGRARLAFEHFRARGMIRFACYAPPIGRYPSGRGLEFARTVREAGHLCELFSPRSDRTSSGWLADYRLATEWLATLEKPVAVFASDPYPARQIAEICERNGVRIPEEVALMSGDNDELLCQTAWPPISSVELASHRIGEEACFVLKRRMNGGRLEPEPHLIPPLRVLARHSTDILQVADNELAGVLRAIRDRATSGLEVKDLLKEFPISRRSLEIKFRQAIGRTPAEEIRRVRLDQARRLLLETDRSIDSIAHAVGFSSGPALSTAFRKFARITPGELRATRMRFYSESDREG